METENNEKIPQGMEQDAPAMPSPQAPEANEAEPTLMRPAEPTQAAPAQPQVQAAPVAQAAPAAQPAAPAMTAAPAQPAAPAMTAPAARPAAAAPAASQAQAQPQSQTQAGSTLVRPQPAPQRTGYGYAQQPSYAAPRTYTAPAPTVDASTVRTRTKTIGRGRSLLWGLIGGALGAAAVMCGLFFTGVLNPSANGSIVSPKSSQPITISASDTDISVAKAVSAKTLPSVVTVSCTLAAGTSTGSGVILDAEGNIITNNHVVEGAQSVTVSIEGVTYDATVVGADASSDLAVLHAELNGAQVTPIEIGDSSALSVGDWVMTVGSPFGLDSSVSAGIVSSLYRSELMYGTTGNTLYANLIQVDAAINPGNSGGALVNDRGQLVGICTLFSSDTQSFAGIGFAIPGNYAVEIAQMIISGKQATHAYIGLSMMTVNAQNAAANNLSVDYGAYVAEVAEGGPAEAAGIEVGDIVIAIGGERIASSDKAVLAIRTHSIGEKVTVTVMRGDEQLDFEVTLSSDEKLQELQRQQLEQQQMETEQQYDFWNQNGEGNGDGGTYEEMFQRFIEELMNGQNGQNPYQYQQQTPEGMGRP